MEEDERQRPQPAAPELGGRLDHYALADLEAYLLRLRAEMARVEAEIEKRRALRGAAEALFKTPKA